MEVGSVITERLYIDVKHDVKNRNKQKYPASDYYHTVVVLCAILVKHCDFFG